MEGHSKADRTALRRRVAGRIALGVGVVITFLCLLLVAGAWKNDLTISSHIGYANAEVSKVSFGRTVIRYNTPDGAVHSPTDGVLYPEGLAPGQIVRVEYDQRNPELVRVAGRSATLSLLPLGLVVLVTWALVLGARWWLRRDLAEPVTA